MRRAFVFLYAFLVLGFPAFADSVKVGDFEVEEFGTGAYLDVTITSYSGQGGELSMQIPGRPITIIGSEVFAGREITSVEIPTTVTEIRDGAFRGNLLEVLELPGALATIGEEAFSGNDLKQVVLPPYTETVGDRAFAGNRITRITIEADVNLGGNSFDHNFTSWYLAAGRNAGTYIYRLGRWYLESEWLEISAMDDDPIDRSPEAIEPRADIPPTINLGLSGYETVPVMDFEVVGPVSVTKQEVIDFGPLGIRTSRTGSRVTYFDLMMEAASLGADDVVGVHIDTRLDWTRMLFDFVRGYRMTYTYTGTGIAVKYTGTLEQLKSARHRNIEGQDIGYGARVERFRRDMAEPDTPSNETDLYPLLSVGGYTTYNSRSGESSVTGAIGGVETRLSENFFLGLEGGVYPFYYEYGGSKKVHGFSIADIYAGLAFDIGFLSLEGMAGLYFRNEDKNFGPQDRYGFGYIVGGNVGFRSGPHYLFGAFRYAEELNTDDNESLQTFSPGVGYKYTFMPTLADYYAEKYRKAMDRELKGAFTDTPYPLLSVGGYSAYNWTEGTKRGSSGRSGFMSGLELHLSEFFFLGLEGGGFPFSYDKGSGTELDSFFTSDIYAGLAFDIGGLSLEALGGLYYRKEAAGPEGRSGLGYIAGGNAGFRLGPHYLFGAFRYAAELNEFDGEEPVSGISVGAGYKYTYIPRLPDYEEEYQDTLARERDALETADGPVDSGSLYPLLKIGGYGMRSLAKDRDGNYSLGGMATLEAHFAGGSPFAGMEVGAIPLIYDDPHSGIRESTSKLMGLGYVGLPLPTAGDFAFELLLGAYLRDDAYDDGYDDEDPGLGYMLGMNAGFHSGAAYIFGTYRHFKDTSLSTNIIGLGMKYALVSEEDEPVLTELRHRGYRELPDPATEDLTYPVFGAGAWYGVGTLDEEGSLSNVYAFTGEVRFSEYFGLVMEAGTLRFGYDQQNMYGWDDYVYENFGIFSLLGELILQPVEGFELDFLAGLYYGGHNSKGRFISKGIGLESGVNAGVRLDRNYIYYMFRAATYVDYGNGHNASEYSLMQGIGYRYLFSDEAEKPETLADSRRKREWRIEDAHSQAPYPFISVGVWGGINLETDFIENEELGEEKYPIAGLAFLDLHLTENFGFALETGRMAFEWEKVTMYPTGYFGGYYYQNEDVTTTEFIVSVLEEFTLPLGQDFQLDLLAGLYYGGHNTGGGFEGGANLRLKWGNHNFAAMFRVGQSFYEYSRGPYNDSDTEDFTVIGGGYIYNFQTETADTRKIPPQYIGAADDDPADSAHPFLRTGGWGGLAVMPSDGHSNMGAFVASADIVFARYFALGMEAGSMPFRRTERNPWSGASESMTDANGTGALFAEFTVQASDVIETSLILGSYYGGEKGGLGLLYCGADVGFVFGRHHILGIFRYARDSFSASEKMAVAGGGYKYDLY